MTKKDNDTSRSKDKFLLVTQRIPKSIYMRSISASVVIKGNPS